MATNPANNPIVPLVDNIAIAIESNPQLIADALKAYFNNKGSSSEGPNRVKTLDIGYFHPNTEDHEDEDF